MVKINFHHRLLSKYAVIITQFKLNGNLLGFWVIWIAGFGLSWDNRTFCSICSIVSGKEKNESITGGEN